MNKRYYCTEVEDCETCQGGGTVYSSLWLTFESFTQKFVESKPNYTPQELDEIQDKWWKSEGFETWLTDCSDLPPEEEYCPDCEGKAIFTRKVDLREALRAVCKADPSEIAS